MILDGKKSAKILLDHIKHAIDKSQDRPPKISFILVGEDVGSQAYVRMKKRRSEEIGMISEVVQLPSDVIPKELHRHIQRLNNDSSVDGILVQQPLPGHIPLMEILSAVDPKKDVDGFHPMNIGKLLIGDDSGFTPCTPLGIHRLLIDNHIPIEGKQVTIVGRSNIVGKPLGALLMQKRDNCNATVTIAHSRSEDLQNICKRADILIAAVGIAKFITKDFVKPGSTVIDVGINRVDGKLVGDVDFDNVKSLCSNITKVPGGVGPMTIAYLLSNTLKSYLDKPTTP